MSCKRTQLCYGDFYVGALGLLSEEKHHSPHEGFRVQLLAKLGDCALCVSIGAAREAD